MKKGIIFDFNGTMIFDSAFHDRAWNAFLSESVHRQISQAEMQEFVYGRSAQDILSHFLKRPVSGAESIEIEEQKEQLYRKFCLKSPEFRLADGLPEFLDSLQQKQIPVTIATASAKKNIEFFFEHLPLSRWFDREHIVYNDGTFPGKPAPDIFLKAVKILHCSPVECIVFEDAKSGIQAAKNAGIGEIIGVSSSLDRQALLSCGADRVISDYHILI